VDEERLTDLAVACQRGDKTSFQTLVESMTRTLIAMAYRYTRDWEWARDLTQDTWIRVHDRIHDYDASRSFRSWLFAVHRNRCLDHLRKAWVRREQATQHEDIMRLRLVSGSDDPHVEIERMEFHRHLGIALDELSEIQRQVFVRVDVEQIPQRDVAEDLGMKFPTLRTTLHHARKRLAGALRTMEE
jgi:RNA polymerase sigma-70 factor (ECF subfamily)